VPAGALTINSEVAATSAPFALQNSTVVTPASYVFRREGTAWTAKGRVVPADYGMGSGNASAVKYRDGVLVTDFIPKAQHRPDRHRSVSLELGAPVHGPEAQSRATGG
jgi:hypothetical protein